MNEHVTFWVGWGLLGLAAAPLPWVGLYIFDPFYAIPMLGTLAGMVMVGIAGRAMVVQAHHHLQTQARIVGYARLHVHDHQVSVFEVARACAVSRADVRRVLHEALDHGDLPAAVHLTR